MYLEARMADVPNPENEMKALGDNARARTEAVGLWVGQNFQNEEISVIERLCTTAAGVKVMERIMNMMRDSGDESVLRPGYSESVTEEDVKKMMQDRRYWSPSDRDPNYIKKVERFFQKKYGQAGVLMEGFKEHQTETVPVAKAPKATKPKAEPKAKEPKAPKVLELDPETFEAEDRLDASDLAVLL